MAFTTNDDGVVCCRVLDVVNYMDIQEVHNVWTDAQNQQTNNDPPPESNHTTAETLAAAANTENTKNRGGRQTKGRGGKV